jgi:hypothetical protein
MKENVITSYLFICRIPEAERKSQTEGKQSVFDCNQNEINNVRPDVVCKFCPSNAEMIITFYSVLLYASF